MKNLSWIVPVLVVVAACSSDGDDGDDGDDAPPEPVYYGQIDRILNDSCAGCHSADDDRLAPFSLASYDDAAAAAEVQPIAYAVMNRIMPPYYADDSGDCQSFKDNHWLSDDDLATLVAWVNGARSAGDPAAASPPPAPLPTLSEVDAVLDPGADYTPNPGVDDDFRCFVLDAPAATDQFLVAYDVQPGNATVVHHVIAYTFRDAAAQAEAEQLDALDSVPGYECRGGVRAATDWLAAWVPGSGASFLPPDTGVRVPGGRKLLVQVHYNLGHSDGRPDRTTIDLDLAPAVGTEAQILTFPAPINLPPGQPDVTAVGTITLPATLPPFRVWSALVHMHQRGLGGTTVRETRTNTCLIDYANYSFHWQHNYWYEQPVTLRGGDTLELTCHYDTTGDAQTVTWGEGTESEMCLAVVLASP